MNLKDLLRLVCLIFSVMYLSFVQSTFSEQYKHWGLPTDAKTRFGKGRISDIKYFPDGNKIAVATGVGTWIYDVPTGKEIDLQ
ncbi:hypothetical protein C6503_25560 [Candidatus Poribacteria bacterium]|nr:MAG: hypothetical protein C6503_25560 [Candidatus Poribacteria bacterium]